MGGLVALPLNATATQGWRELSATGLGADGTRLVAFDTGRPGATKSYRISGLDGDTSLVGIDYRVQNGKLYGVGNSGGIYLFTGKSTATKVGQLSVALEGARFGVDFNPAANALRVISDTGQNLRQPFGTGAEPMGATVTDGTLAYLGVTATGIAGAAYTNNDLDPNTATSLFDIDTALDQVVLQSPANTGSLAATGKLTVDAGADAGFDIYSTVRRGRAVGAKGFASLSVGGAYRLYAVNLLTGEVDDRGRFPYPVTDLAIKLKQR